MSKTIKRNETYPRVYILHTNRNNASIFQILVRIKRLRNLVRAMCLPFLCPAQLVQVMWSQNYVS